jgi:hypothetical protein
VQVIQHQQQGLGLGGPLQEDPLCQYQVAKDKCTLKS